MIVQSDAVMMAAVDFGRHELVRWLLSGVPMSNAKSMGSQGTALQSAAWFGDLEMVKLLVLLSAGEE